MAVTDILYGTKKENNDNDHTVLNTFVPIDSPFFYVQYQWTVSSLNTQHKQIQISTSLT